MNQARPNDSLESRIACSPAIKREALTAPASTRFPIAEMPGGGITRA
jgi:hypothetical protein